MSLINIHGDITSRARGLNFGPSLHLHPYSVYTSSEGSGESVCLSNAIGTKISCVGPIVQH